MFKKNYFSGWTTAEQAAKDCDLAGKVAIVTGANTGIGKETTRVLALHHAHVILACRDEKRGKEATEQLSAQLPKENLEFMKLDLGDLSSVREFAKNFLEKNIPLHFLINNAGIMMVPYNKTKDGFESQLGTNHLGHFLLTNLLLDKI